MWQEIEVNTAEWGLHSTHELHKAGYWGYQCCEQYIEDENEE